ncbi:MAG: ImmA/IrrE family metallo-endopeptidase [Raoultibacter sp.]
MGMKPNLTVLAWAMRRAGKTPEDLKSISPKIEQWIEGTWTPTIKQLEEFAHATHVSFAALFSDDIPSVGLQIADFRTTSTGAIQSRLSDPSPELFDTIDHMMLRQDWMRDYFSEEGYAAVSFVGKYEKQSVCAPAPQEMAEAMHTDLSMPTNWAASCKTYGEALRFFKDKVEAAGVSVVVSGLVKDNTHRKLSVDEFRGFVLADNLAPLVFINGRDAKSAQIFTLAHEVAHLYFATSGVISPATDKVEENEAEQLCDAIAAEFLVPSSEFIKYWRVICEERYEAIKSAANHFKVSFTVCARKARDLELISQKEFFTYYYKHETEVSSLEQVPKRKVEGGDYYKSKNYRLGTVFSEAIFSAVQSRRLTYSEAFRLTGFTTATFDAFFKEGIR